jgi:hypothetical protein
MAGNLTTQQQAQAATKVAEAMFGGVTNVVASYSLDQIQAAVAAVDNAFNTTLNAAVIAVGGATTIANGLSSQITASMPGATAAQQTIVACYTLMKRAGII